jgi:hypothetical protein
MRRISQALLFLAVIFIVFVLPAACSYTVHEVTGYDVGYGNCDLAIIC